MKIEKRKHPRIDVWIEVTFKSSNEFVTSYMSNISKGGVYIQTEDPMDLGTVLALTFQLPGQENLIKIKGKVVWYNPPGGMKVPGMGVQFAEMPEEDRHILEGFLEAHK